MSRKRDRVDRMKAALTPQQAVLVWMEEAHRAFPNMRELARSLRGQPTSTFPLSRLQEQVADAVVAANKGQARPVVAQALHQALRDMYFLYHLYITSNSRATTDMAVWNWQIAALSERLRAMRVEDAFRSIIRYAAVRVSMDMPYPVDPKTAATVEAAIRHHVSTWDLLDEDGTIATWVFNHLVQQGATKIPDDAFRYEGIKCIPTLTAGNKDEVRACFRDQTEFERFSSGEDYGNGLADVTDAEFNAHYDRLVSSMRELVASGQVRAGKALVLDSVPIPFLKESPLVEGQWLDRHVAELAEWGRLLKEKGFHAVADDDGHPLVGARIVGHDGQQIEADVMKSLGKAAVENVDKFKGPTTRIEGRPYLDFEAYCAWQKRRAKEKPPTLFEGLLTSSWNAWVETQGGEGMAAVAGVPVESLSCPVESHLYQVCPTGAVAMIDSRKQLLALMRCCQSDPEREAEDRDDWHAAAETFLVELYSLRESLNLVSRRYFAGHPVLFSDTVRDFDQLIREVEELAAKFNSDFAKDAGASVDLEAIRRGADRSAAQLALCVVDTAKAEALTEVGEQATAMSLIERYL